MISENPAKGGRRRKTANLRRGNLRVARRLFGESLPAHLAQSLAALSEDLGFSLINGELQLINGAWYVTHTGLVRLARRKKCIGIQVEAVAPLSNTAARRFVFKAVVYTNKNSSGFVGYGDADPSNVSPLVRGAEMRVAETRAVNRALRKAYGIGICSLEEIGSVDRLPELSAEAKKAPQPSNGHGEGTGCATLRDRLCLIIRQHQLNPNLVKSYAADFCSVKTLREATREQVENFVAHLADWAQTDRNALLCQLNSYMPPKEGVA